VENLILILHIVACVALVILVLLQAGKEGMGVIFGGGSQSMFGSGGAGGMIAKLTGIMAVIFLFTSLSYNYMTGHSSSDESGIIDVKIEEKSAQDKPLLLEEAAPKQEPAEKPAQ
jgi:preprotein translocase subunit SecG